MDPSREPVVVTAIRTPVGKANRGGLRTVRPDELAALVIRAALQKTPGLDPEQIDDVMVGCAFPEGSQGMNMARVAALRAGLPDSVPGMTVNRFCSSGLQTIALAADRIQAGHAEVILAGGAESMSQVPMGGERYLPHPELVVDHPETYLGMGITAEVVAERYEVSGPDQNAFAYESHRKALDAQKAGRFDDELVPVEVTLREPGPDGVRERRHTVDRDEGPRADTSVEALERLRPVFQEGGTVTAGNASQTSDGAAMAVVMSRARADALGLRPMAAFRGFAVAGVPPEVMGIGPVEAIPKLLAATGVALDDIDLVELNEAFAAQALAVIRRVGIDPARVNVNGGAIALGHPLGATGAKLTASLLHEMGRRKSRYGMVTMCVGGGMGAAGLFERTDG